MMRGENEVKIKNSTAVTIYDLQHQDPCSLIGRLLRRRRVHERARKFCHVQPTPPTVCITRARKLDMIALSACVSYEASLTYVYIALTDIGR